MRYRNKKTGAEISSATKISGGDWREVKSKDKPKAKAAESEEPKQGQEVQPKGPQNEADGDPNEGAGNE